MLGQSRAEIENLTYLEVVEVLTMADMEEQDRRHFVVAVKSDDPLKTYNEIRSEIDEALTPKPDLGEMSPSAAAWLRKQS
jgi:hypothetical protein